MAIQFLCPSCRQPIEVDDQWASRTVACPYCRNTVAAPEQSTFHREEGSPLASPLASPTAGLGHPPLPPAASVTSPAASWGLGLSSTSVVLLLAANLTMAPGLARVAGQGASAQEVQKALMEMVQAGDWPGWLAGGVGMMLAAFVCWVAGLVASIIAFGRPARRRAALGALAIELLFLLFVCGPAVLL